MKYLVFSDVHGSLYYAKKMKDIIAREKPDKIILLGDLYYHGPRNNLSEEYNPMEVANILNKYKNSILCIKGNCDAEVDEMISEFPFQENITLEINNKNFLFTHGHKYNKDNIPPNIDVLVYGHFHMPFIEIKDNVICVNSGSISLPKNNSAHTYLIIDNNLILIKDIDNNIIYKELF